MFTENLREGFRNVGFFESIFLKIYKTIKLPCRPIYGGFPVKFRTYLGKPIEYDPNLSVEELQMKTADAIRNLINEHQRIPGSILHALLDRFRNKRKKDS